MDAHGFGLLTSIMAVGTVTGAVLAAGRARPKFIYLFVSATVFGLGCAMAALAPTAWFFGAVLIVIGIAGLTFTNSTNSLTQLATEPTMRGRVMALRLAIFMGGTPIGAPIVGYVADRFGARWSLAAGASAGFAAAAIGLWYLVRFQQLTLRVEGGWLRVGMGEDAIRDPSRGDGQ
jgi:MFS family permease